MGIWEGLQLRYYEDRLRFLGLAAGVGLILAIVVAAIVTGGSERTTGSETGAWVVCTERVAEQLRSPSTADFPAMRSADITGGPTEYAISSYVDAENAFGATVREPWTCEARFTGGDSWSVRASVG